MANAAARALDLRGSEDECGDSALKLVRRTMNNLAPGEVVEVISDGRACLHPAGLGLHDRYQPG